MHEVAVNHGLQMCWVPVVDDRGRTHMEAHWTAAEELGHVSVTHAA